MADIKPIKPIKLCVNITIPTIDDDSISLYECVGILGNKLQEAIQKINESLGSLEGAYTADNPPPYPVTSVNGKTGEVVIDIPANVYTEDNPPPYPVTSVNGKTGAVVIDIPANVYTEDNPPPYPVTSVNRAETKDVITVFEPEGGGIEDVSQAELIAACKAGARLGAFNQDDGTCRLYHFNLYIDPERVDYNEVAGGGASGVASVNDQTGAVNIFNAPISAATAESVTALNASTNTKINQLKNDIGDAWVSGTTYAVGDYCISGNQLYKCKTAHTSGGTFNQYYWEATSVSDELSKRLDSDKISFVTKTVVTESNKTAYNLDVNRSQYMILSIECVDRYGWRYGLTSGVSGTESIEKWALVFYDQPSGTYNFKLMLYKI